MRSPLARYVLLAVALILAVSLIPTPGKPPLAYRALRHFGVIAAIVPKPAAPGMRLPLGDPVLSPFADAPARFVQRPGHPLLIDIFATWCPYCRDEMAVLSALTPSLKRAGIDVAGIDQAENPSEVQAAVQAFAISYPVYIDAGDNSWVTAAHVIPTTILVDKNGIVRFVHSGPLNRAQILHIARAVSRVT